MNNQCDQWFISLNFNFDSLPKSRLQIVEYILFSRLEISLNKAQTGSLWMPRGLVVEPELVEGPLEEASRARGFHFSDSAVLECA